MATLKLFRHPLSGHSHRVELFLSILQERYDLIDVDLANGEHLKAPFRALNRFVQVPVLQDSVVYIADSNAILVYLAKRHSANTWLPGSPELAAQVQQFLSVAAGPLAYGPAAARLVTVFGADLDHDLAVKIAHDLFDVLDEHLSWQNWLVGETPTIADIANYSYIAHAPEGNVSLDLYPNIRSWLRRLENLPGFVEMQHTAVGLASKRT